MKDNVGNTMKVFHKNFGRTLRKQLLILELIVLFLEVPYKSRAGGTA